MPNSGYLLLSGGNLNTRQLRHLKDINQKKQINCILMSLFFLIFGRPL